VSITPSKSPDFVYIPINVIIDIAEIPEGVNDTYEAFYTSGNNSSLRVNGIGYGLGQQFQCGPTQTKSSIQVAMRVLLKDLSFIYFYSFI